MQKNFYYPDALVLSEDCRLPFFYFTKELEKECPAIQWSILGKPVAMLDCHVAEVFGKKTSNFNTQVERNIGYFRSNWRFRPLEEEWKALKSFACEMLSTTAKGLVTIFGAAAYNSSPPWFYTKLGIYMSAFFQRTPVARQQSIRIVETFEKFERDAFDPKTDPRVQIYLQEILDKKPLPDDLSQSDVVRTSLSREFEVLAEPLGEKISREIVAAISKSQNSLLSSFEECRQLAE